MEIAYFTIQMKIHNNTHANKKYYEKYVKSKGRVSWIFSCWQCFTVYWYISCICN